MSSLKDAFEITRKAFLVSDQLDRLASDVVKLTSTVAHHEGRLIRVETTLDSAQRSSRLIPPGN
jgi:hypothetical protein